jgi:hypothetical protein
VQLDKTLLHCINNLFVIKESGINRGVMQSRKGMREQHRSLERERIISGLGLFAFESE